MALVGSMSMLSALAGCASSGTSASDANDSSTTAAAGEAKEEHAPAGPSALDPLKALAGTWECDFDGDGTSDCTAIYKVSANGYTVTENLFVGTPHEMVTAFHMDGTSVMATHYCAAGNQPRMRDAHPGKHSFRFDFVDATNLKSIDDMHMHSLRMEIIDADHLTNTWTNYMNGKPNGEVSFKFTRKKG
jgi:S-formylglutathione hydrolase FrmB